MTTWIHLLGVPRIEVDREPIGGPRGSKAWALLAYLLLNGAPARRERLAGLLFGDAADPLGTLRWNLAELRRALGSSVSFSGDPVAVRPSAECYVDVLTLRSATWLEAVQVPSLGQALLEGIDVEAEAAFDTWLLAERRHVANVSAGVLHEAGTARLAMGQPDQAVALATKLVALDEYDEEANILLIRSYLAIGARDQAKEHLESTLARYRNDLGADPSPALLDVIRIAPPALPPDPSFVQGAAAAESLITAGEAAVGAGVFEAGLEVLRRAVVVAREADAPRVEARALVVLGTAFVHAGRGRSGEGATSLHEGLQLAERIGSSDLVAEACRELGYLDMKEAHYDRASTWVQRALESSPDSGSRSAAKAVLGVIVSDQGRTTDGLRLLAEAAALGADSNKPRLEAWANAFHARTHIVRQEWDAARSSATRSLELSRSAGWVTFLALPQSLLATVDLATGRVDEAAAAFESAFALGCQIADPCWEGIAARGIGLVHQAHGRTGEAITWLDDARTRCIRIPDAYLWMHAFCLDALCDLAVSTGHTRAPEWVRDLETVAARTGMNEMLVRAQLHRADLGEGRAIEAAHLFADRIDNPAVLERVAALDRAVPSARPSMSVTVDRRPLEEAPHA